MRIGIIGAGNVGSTLAQLLVRRGHEVTLSHRGPRENLRDLVAGLGERARAGAPEEAARFGDVVVLALPFGRFGELPTAPFGGKTVIDATNYYPERDGHFPEMAQRGLGSSELIDHHLAGARLVKAFNNLPMNVLAERARPRGTPGRLALPLAGDHTGAKQVVARLIDDAGFDPVDVGGLAEGGRLQQQGGPLFLRPLSDDELRATLGLGGGAAPHAP